jgi:probable phosphoglycerate mutase
VTRLLLLRHAESEWNAEGRWQGLADPPLSPWGEEQAAHAGRLLGAAGVTGLVSSDLQRARATAARIAADLPGAGPVTLEPELREYDVGAWSGLTRPEIEAGWPGAIDDWRHGRLFSTPGGERRDVFVTRICRAVTRVARERPAEVVLVVTHGGVIAALCRTLGAPGRRFGHLAGVWVEAGARLALGPFVSLLDGDPRWARNDDRRRHQPAVSDTPGR